MTTISRQREIGECKAICLTCEWIWIPRENTQTKGSKGSRNAVMGAKDHGKHNQHKVVVTREVIYNFIGWINPNTKKYKHSKRRKRNGKS